jgi:hypothetical protein
LNENLFIFTFIRIGDLALQVGGGGLR